VRRGGAGTEAEPHSGPHEVDGAGGCLPLLRFGAHAACPEARSTGYLPFPLPPASEASAMSSPIIAFDLDGTLVDTAPDLIHT
jgi:hypothetical protein